MIAYTVLAGYPPFFAERDEPDTDETVLKKIVAGQWEFHSRTWSGISDEAKDFVRSLLVRNPEARPSCQEALAHTWVADRRALAQKRAQLARQKAKASEFYL